jgi:RimK family alpha-L-glutamate ligase
VSARPIVWVVGYGSNETNGVLADAWRRRGIPALRVDPGHAGALGEGDVAIGRIDVLPTLDGIEPGLLELHRLERRGVRVLNRAVALLAVHDKLRTARRLASAGVPHPLTRVVRGPGAVAGLEPPVVLKPRLGSWGRDVFRCLDREQLAAVADEIGGRSWFRRHGVVVQELVPPRGHDLRLLVAGGEVVGAARRVARPGEWRTNVSLGGSLRRTAVPAEAERLACAAAAAVGIDLVGVDLLPTEAGHVVLELNGAVDFDTRYALPGADLYAEIGRALRLPDHSVDPRSAIRA